MKLIAMLVTGVCALVTVVTFFRLLGFWGALLLLFLVYVGTRRG